MACILGCSLLLGSSRGGLALLALRSLGFGNAETHRAGCGKRVQEGLSDLCPILPQALAAVEIKSRQGSRQRGHSPTRSTGAGTGAGEPLAQRSVALEAEGQLRCVRLASMVA